MLTCRDVAAFLGDYLDRALPWRQRLRFRLHLLLCRDCRRYLDSYRKTVEACRSLGVPPAVVDHDCGCDEAAVPVSLVRAILAARQADAATHDSDDGSG